jgi:hypothetical protein
VKILGKKKREKLKLAERCENLEKLMREKNESLPSAVEKL